MHTKVQCPECKGAGCSWCSNLGEVVMPITGAYLIKNMRLIPGPGGPNQGGDAFPKSTPKETNA